MKGCNEVCAICLRAAAVVIRGSVKMKMKGCNEVCAICLRAAAVLSLEEV